MYINSFCIFHVFVFHPFRFIRFSFFMFVCACGTLNVRHCQYSFVCVCSRVLVVVTYKRNPTAAAGPVRPPVIVARVTDATGPTTPVVHSAGADDAMATATMTLAPGATAPVAQPGASHVHNAGTPAAIARTLPPTVDTSASLCK